MEFMAIAMFAFLGGIVGYLVCLMRPQRQEIGRFVQLDQRHYERWQAYCRMLGQEPEIRTWREPVARELRTGDSPPSGGNEDRIRLALSVPGVRFVSSIPKRRAN